MGSRQDKRQKDLQRKKAVRSNKEVQPSFRYLITLSYDGSSYGGYAKQKHKNTIQNELERVLKEHFNKDITTTESSRTDARVHALDQKVMFDLNEQINIKITKSKLNELLNKGIIIKNIEAVSNSFHCRYDVVSKTYEYIINKELDPRYLNYSWYIKDKLDVKSMKAASKYLIGKHDFSTFKSAKATTDSSIRTINYLEVFEKDNNIVIRINANGFLYNMVRLIVKVLVDVGSNKKEKEYIKELLELKDKPDNLESAPANGLCLIETNYK